MTTAGDVLGNDVRFRHFVQAQETTYAQAFAEVACGEKRTHWMWFIFPQLAGLGSSAMAHRYALGSLQDAMDYLHHPLLGPRLHGITEAVNKVEHHTANAIFGYPDDLKFHSSMTLFMLATERTERPDTVYREALERYFGGALDAGTLRLLPAGVAAAAISA